MAGNRRYLTEGVRHPHQSAQRVAEVAGEQHPIAVVLGCSDSRVLPEVAFDCGVGDLFVVRVAGNVLDDVVLGTIEFAVVALGIQLVIVLGHERCGAISAAITGLKLQGHMASLMAALQPAIDCTDRSTQDRDGDRGREGGRDRVIGASFDPIEAAVRANVRITVAKLRASEPILADSVRSGRLTVIGARYGLDNGRITILGETDIYTIHSIIFILSCGMFCFVLFCFVLFCFILSYFDIFILTHFMPTHGHINIHTLTHINTPTHPISFTPTSQSCRQNKYMITLNYTHTNTLTYTHTS